MGLARGQTWEAGVVSETQHGTQEDLVVKDAKNQAWCRKTAVCDLWGRKQGIRLGDVPGSA